MTTTTHPVTPAVETLSPADTTPLFAAAVKDGTEDQESCPDCTATAGQNCAPDCGSRTESPEIFEPIDPDYCWWAERAGIWDE